MRFAHMSDCHLGSWSNHPDMRDYSIQAFENAIDTCMREKLDFVIIAGDFFDTALPAIDIMRRAAAKLRQCKENGLPIYIIPGSHDYSPTGKTMISVLEDAGLLTDVCKFSIEDGKVKLKFTEDPRTGIKLTGIMGRKGGLDVDYYKDIDRSIENESGKKIFVFHAGVSEYKPENMKDMLTVPIADLPHGFDYYAAGHVHKKFHDEKNNIVFPGELFPTSFDELEDYNGSFVIVDIDDATGKLSMKWQDARLFDVHVMKTDVTGKKPLQVEQEIIANIEDAKLNGKVLLLKLSGMLDGKISDIDFHPITAKAYECGAKIIKRSTNAVKTREFEEIKVNENQSTDDIEKNLIKEHADQLQLSGINDAEDFIFSMINALKDEKAEDETNATFETRLKENTKKILGL